MANPTSEVSRHGMNLIARILPLMAEHRIQFDIPSGWSTIASGQVGISSIFSNWVRFQPHRSKLRHHGLVALEQLLSPDCTVLLSWKELHCLILSLSYAIPQWFVEIEASLGIQPNGSYKRVIQLPPSVVPAVPNPFRTNQLLFPSLTTRVGTFAIVFPGSFPDDGSYFLA